MLLKETDYFRIREQQFSYQGPCKFKAKFDQNALVRITALFSGIYAAPFPNAFIISRCQRLAFSPVFVLLLSPRSAGSSRSVSLSLPFSLSFFFFRFPLVFCRTPSLSILHDTHKHYAHSRSRPPPCLSFLSTTSLSLFLSYVLLFFFSTHPSLPPVFFPHHYNGAALFGPGHKQPRIGTTPWCRLAVILYNTCNGCCDGSPGHPLRERDILYEGETIARTCRSTTGFTYKYTWILFKTHHYSTICTYMHMINNFSSNKRNLIQFRECHKITLTLYFDWNWNTQPCIYEISRILMHSNNP